MTRLKKEELERLQQCAYTLVLELGFISTANYYAGLLPLHTGGERLVLNITRDGARVTNASREVVAHFPGLEAAGILQWLRNLAERVDAQRLAKTLA